jgi:hypothetical protein
MTAGVLVAAMPSCAVLRKWFPQEELEEERPPGEAGKAATRVIGEVAAVYAEEGFVLIRRYGGGELPPGNVYNTVGPGGRTATLKPTGERSGRFYAADLTAGQVERGDSVVLRRLPEGSGPEMTPVQERPKTPFGMQ